MGLRRHVAAALLAGSWLLPAAACETVQDSSRIAVAGGSLTEIIYFLGAEERIVAVDTTSDFPEQERFPSVGYVRALDAEGLLSMRPTLVLGEDDMGPPETVVALRRLGVPVVRVPEVHSAFGILAKVRCVAAALNLAAAAEALIDAKLSPQVEALARLHSERSSRPRAAFLLGLREGAPLGAGRGTSAHGLLSMAGAENVLAGFEGWKPVSTEAMADAAPEHIVMGERGVGDAGGDEQVLAHPALRLTPAGRGSERRLIVVNDMAALGFGPRTLQSALRLALQLRTGAASAPGTLTGR